MIYIVYMCIVLCASYCYSLFVYHYLLFIYLCLLFIIVIHLFRSLFDFSFTLCSTFVLIWFFCFPLFIVHCSKEKSSILILDCIPGILILRTTSSMQANKHHTADCTDFVLVQERRTYYDHHIHSRIDKTNILQEVIAVEGKTLGITFLLLPLQGEGKR
jgi:hypothetical protein